MSFATIDDALELTVRYFRGITDSDGEPYILHCLRVMHGVTGPLVQQVALMHDLVEDTEVSLEQLQQLNFDPRVVEAVALISHPPGMSYAEYVVRLKANELARQAKLSDLRDNASLQRVLYRADHLDKDLLRVQRYLLSYQFLTDRIDELHYRQQMKRVEEDLC